ncbi:helix-hairpin-helix domain-containing protein [Embleya sp. NPDC001921]
MNDGDMESGPQDAVEPKADERGGAEGRSGGKGTSRAVESALSNPEAASTEAPEVRPKPDPVALLRDQLARLARGEAPTVVGGVDHIDTPHGDGAERARRRTALAAEAAAAAALAAAEAAAREENATGASSTNEKSTALHTRPLRDVELPPTAHTESTAHNPPRTASTTDNTPTAAPNHATESTALAPEHIANPPAAPPADDKPSTGRNASPESTALAASDAVSPPPYPAAGDRQGGARDPLAQSTALATSDAASAPQPPSAADEPDEEHGGHAESTALASSDAANATLAAPVGNGSGEVQTSATGTTPFATSDAASPPPSPAAGDGPGGAQSPLAESTALAASDALSAPSPPAAGDRQGGARDPLAESTALASSEIAGATSASVAGGESAEAQDRSVESTALGNSAAQDRHAESTALGNSATDRGEPKPDAESSALVDGNRSAVRSSPAPESTALEASSASEAISEAESSAHADSIETGSIPNREAESTALDGSGSVGGAGRESGALSGERWHPGGGAQAHVEAGPASGGGVARPSSRGDDSVGAGGWGGPGIGGEADVAAAAESAAGAATTAAPTPPPDPARRPFAAVVADVARLLVAAGAPERMASQVATALGSEAAEMLAADPWALLAVPGIAPQQADLFARGALGAGWIADDPRRVRAIVLWLLRRAARQGDTAIEADAARAALAHFEVGDPDTALRAILAEGRVMAFAAAPAAPAGLVEDDGDFGAIGEIGESEDDFDADFDEGFEEPDELAAVGGVLLALDDYALAEEAIAEAVVRLMSTVEPWPETGDTKLDRALGTNGVLLYAAGPGEEPPAAILTVAANARNAGLRVAVVAPTIDGRDRLGAGAVGLRELAAMERGPDGTLELDLLVVTDATLLDVTAAAAIFEAVPDGARLLLAGDPAGLESTGPGRVFTDLAATGAVRALVAPTVPDDPPAALADGIRDGRLPPIQDPERRVVLIPAHSGEEAAHRCAQLVADSIPRAIGIAARDVLVVAPLATGPAGATALNAALKARLNPGRETGPGVGSSAMSGDGGIGTIDVGDRVIRARPDTSGGVVQGIVREALPDGRVVVAFGTAAPEAVRRAELRHGWALTARQSLGVRRPAAVVVLPAEGADAYTRALMYTLVTRGEQHVSIVHAAGPALAAAVAADPTRLRTTHLQQALREAAG